MSLDKNLFTLHLTPHKDNATVIDLVDPSGTIHYRKQRVQCPEYKIEVYDLTSESLLATATSPGPTNKVKTLELYNPTSVIELKSTGTLSFRWAFKWEDNEFEWKREECYMIRKPDPPVIVAVTKETTGKLKMTSVQILDYNLNRFDIDDRKGLEIIILTALLTFQDANETAHNPDAGSAPANNPRSRLTSTAVSGASLPPDDLAPPPPPKPAPKTGIDRIAELQAIKGEYNEIIVSDEGTIHDYGEYCNRLLQDDAMLFITVKSSEADHVPKVLQVVEETKRIRHKAGVADGEELHQYVLYDTHENKKGPRRINLDDNTKNKYAPPKNLTVHLSKISMPELQPKGHVKDKPSKDSKKKEDKKATTAKSARATPPTSASSPLTTHIAQPKPSGNKSSRPTRSSPNSRVHAHQVHPNQPPPPPPTYPSDRPAGSQGVNRPPGSSAPFFPQPQLPFGGTSPSLYSSHAPHSSGNSYLAQSSNFPPQTWPGPSSPPPPKIHQPQPVNAAQNMPPPLVTKPSSVVQGASTVVQGLMDKLLTRR